MKLDEELVIELGLWKSFLEQVLNIFNFIFMEEQNFKNKNSY